MLELGDYMFNNIDEKMNVNNPIHIALAIWDLTDDYNRHACVTMVSILENTNNKVIFHLLYDNKLSEKSIIKTKLNIEIYAKIEEKYGIEILYHHIDLPDWVLQLPAINYYTPGSLYRFNIPDVVDKSIEKIIYLDIDIVVTMDIYDLWNIDIENYSIGAVCNELTKLSPSQKKYYDKLGINVNQYFNSGVLLMNLKKMRDTQSLPYEGYSLLQQYPAVGKAWPDQDILNALFQKDMLRLEKKYNTFVDYNSRIMNIAYNKNEADNAILHFLGHNKPWRIYYGGEDRYYWEYLVKTPWCSEKILVLNYVWDAPNMSLAFQRLPEWIYISSPKTQLKYIWLILTQVICKILVYDIKYIYAYISHRNQSFISQKDKLKKK